MGIGAYALYTDECVRIMGLADPAGAGLIEHRETYDIVGEVTGWVRDLEAVWQEAEASSALVVGAAQAAWTTSFTFEGPPAIVWEWITSPARRLQWQIGVDAVNEDVAGGRRGVGTTNHCVHGRDAIVEEVLAWHPPEVLTTRFQMPMPGVPKLTRTELFEATPDGDKTLFTVRVQRPSSAKDRAKLEEMATVPLPCLRRRPGDVGADDRGRCRRAVGRDRYRNLTYPFLPGGTSPHGRDGRGPFQPVARIASRRWVRKPCSASLAGAGVRLLVVMPQRSRRSRARRRRCARRASG